MRNQPQRVSEPFETLGLDPAQTALYTAVLRLHRATRTDLAQAMDGTVEKVGRQLDDLVKLGVVDEQSGEYLARHPAAALGRVIAERLDRLAEESRRIDSALGSIRGLIRDYDAGRNYQSGTFPVEMVNGADVLYESVVGIAVQSPPMQLLTAIPDERTMHDFARKFADPWIDAQNRQLLTVHVIVPVSTLSLPGVRDQLTRLAETGGKVRTLDRVPSWFMTAGPEVAGLPALWGGNLPDHAYNFYLVRTPIVVGMLRSLFEELWGRAVPLPWGRRGDGMVQVLRLAAQGMCDDSIARQLGVSVRTVRARFADAMAELGAQSRFHAGVEAARRGWLG
ncbi:MAG: helix-turn-helix transcriptional regulator [Nonomuraea sp.]|nr:helix-turn-helix transcriptional regulator [Nonomuraea sp.]NUP64036.1 helix-turn-helix transcriptional regulator [Nonomuraea sp.]NUP77753.1 helix-turn-helix transcriptional regulator [Nonomuraea sp.]NUS01488.1 helix-turn-helix transcriptional regulator [Nonomuraea sp.]NUT11009.1 helix-turn-helix transcriptional regulator [Nonomuraea sp.]